MIFKETILKVADNSGAIFAKCIGISNLFTAYLGDIITVSIIKTLPNCKIKKGEIHKALIIRTKKGVTRKDGSNLKFDENSLILLEPDLTTPKGSRIFGPLPIEISSNSKVISLATKII